MDPEPNKGLNLETEAVVMIVAQKNVGSADDQGQQNGHHGAQSDIKKGHL